MPSQESDSAKPYSEYKTSTSLSLSHLRGLILFLSVEDLDSTQVARTLGWYADSRDVFLEKADEIEKVDADSTKTHDETALLRMAGHIALPSIQDSESSAARKPAQLESNLDRRKVPDVGPQRLRVVYSDLVNAAPLEVGAV
jgi:hypothetical protein